jgi:hypothetical protein
MLHLRLLLVLLTCVLLTACPPGGGDDDDTVLDDDDTVLDDDDTVLDDDDSLADDDDSVTDDDDSVTDDDDSLADDDDSTLDDDDSAPTDDDDSLADDDDSVTDDDDSLADDDDSLADDDDSALDDDDSAGDDDDSAAAGPIWYLTCGDPVCSGWTDSGYPLCSDQILGDPCSPEGDICDPQNGCNALYLCTTEDPTAGGCPISRRAHKREIDYLDETDVKEMASQLLGLRLARYRLALPGQEEGQRVGFIIEDAPDLPAIAGDHVDLYTYASMLVAALQAQQGEIDALRGEIEQLKTTCGAAPAARSGSESP